MPRGDRDQTDALIIAPHPGSVLVPTEGRDLVLGKRAMTICLGQPGEKLADSGSFVGH